MSENARIPFVGPNGVPGTLLTRGHGPVFEPDEEVTIVLDDGRRLRVPFFLLERDETGTYRLATDDAGPVRTIVPAAADGQEARIPVIAEELHVEKRVVDRGGVRVRKEVQREDVTVDEPLFREDAVIEHRSVDRIVDTMPQPRTEGDATVIPVVEEVLVISRRYLIKEEVVVRKKRVEHHAPQQVSVMRERAVVERIPPGLDEKSRSPR